MLRLYLDMCCYNRLFDDMSQPKVLLEARAVDIIETGIIEGSYELVWSFILDYENSMGPYPDKTLAIAAWKDVAALFVDDNDEIWEMSTNIMRYGVKRNDSLHIACAIASKCDCFLTTDKRVLNKRIPGVAIVNPLDFSRGLGGDEYD
jgi:hypothetical protein